MGFTLQRLEDGKQVSVGGSPTEERAKSWASRQTNDTILILNEEGAVIWKYTNGVGQAIKPIKIVPPEEQEKILDRVRKLIAHAEGTDNEGEASNYWAKAQEMMAKYAIDQALVRANQKKEDFAKPVVRQVQFFGNKRYNIQKANLLNAVANYNRCRLILEHDKKFMWLVGMEVDVEFCEMLWTSLLLELWPWMLADLKAYKQTGVKDHLNEKTFEPEQAPRSVFINNWLSAFTSRIRTRFWEVEKHTNKQHESGEETVALALRDTKKIVDEYVDVMFGKLGKGRSAGSRSYNQSAANAGSAAGNRANISGRRSLGP